MSTIVAIKGTNGSGKSTVVRALVAHLGNAATLRFNSKEAGYRCRYGDGSLFVLGKYRSACGGLDSSFSYAGAADDLLLCIDTLAAKGHVIAEGVIALTSYGFGRIDTPAELCIARVRQRRLEAGNSKPFNPEKLLHKYESVLRSQEKLREAGYDARILPHEEPLQTLLRWFEERNL